ncbi:hypothetical protein JKP88DRAFT_276279 [Tribonema minus]|uniref:Uncharacterized protein n=1 Tax=Tribonema minus TaxID=303371 RepID=A0A835Z428_9STRA|nr:hypothetical protein JKP88DRAFT_276279 [Tribonema minus]
MSGRASPLYVESCLEHSQDQETYRIRCSNLSSAWRWRSAKAQIQQKQQWQLPSLSFYTFASPAAVAGSLAPSLLRPHTTAVAASATTLGRVTLYPSDDDERASSSGRGAGATTTGSGGGGVVGGTKAAADSGNGSSGEGGSGAGGSSGSGSSSGGSGRGGVPALLLCGDDRTVTAYARGHAESETGAPLSKVTAAGDGSGGGGGALRELLLAMLSPPPPAAAVLCVAEGAEGAMAVGCADGSVRLGWHASAGAPVWECFLLDSPVVGIEKVGTTWHSCCGCGSFTGGGADEVAVGTFFGRLLLLRARLDGRLRPAKGLSGRFNAAAAAAGSAKEGAAAGDPKLLQSLLGCLVRDAVAEQQRSALAEDEKDKQQSVLDEDVPSAPVDSRGSVEGADLELIWARNFPNPVYHVALGDFSFDGLLELVVTTSQSVHVLHRADAGRAAAARLHDTLAALAALSIDAPA